ncbi:MAG: FtsX-like permease family protein [Acidobacteria bacterium]|nr:FtsX-like permease family protein [Acidobacteriota bacterium]
MLWQPLPVSHPEQLARIRAINLPPTEKAWLNGRSVPATERLQLSYPLYRLIGDRKDLFADHAGIMGQGRFSLEVDENTHRAQSTVVSGSFFPLLGLKPAAGRLLGRADDIQGGPSNGWGAVISHKLWKRMFGASHGVVGKRVRIERISFEILGVAPEGFEGVHPGVEVELYIPISSFESMFPDWNWRTSNAHWTVQTFARLNPNASLSEVNQTLHKISEALLTEVAETKLNQEDLKHHKAIQLDAVPASSGFSHVVRNYSPILWLLLGAAGTVLLLAATNLANLTLARTRARRSEIATRLALGASYARLRRQLLLETSLLAIAGIALGVIFAEWATCGLLLAISNDGSALPLKIEPGWHGIAFLSLLLTLAMWIAGWLPASSAMALDTHQRTAAKRDTLLRGGLGMIQFALTLTLLGGATLMLLSLQALIKEPTGFRQSSTLYFTPDLINTGLRLERVPQVYVESLRRIRSSEPVLSAAWVRDVPLAGSLQASSIEIPDRQLSNSLTMIHQISDGYFKTMGIPMLTGEDIPSTDSPRRDTAIVTESLARRYFSGIREALGQRIRVGEGKWLTIIGIAADSKYSHVRDVVSPTLYTSYWDSRSARGLTPIVHHKGNPIPICENVNAIILG